MDKKILSTGKAVGDLFIYIAIAGILFDWIVAGSTLRVITLVGLGIGLASNIIFLLERIFK